MQHISRDYNNGEIDTARPRRLCFVFLFLIFGFALYVCSKPHLKWEQVGVPPHGDSRFELWQSLYTLYLQHAPPHALKLKKKVGIDEITGSTFNYDPDDYLHMNPQSVQQMRLVHDSLIAGIPIYSGNYSGRGIVMVGGGQYLQAGLLSIRMLRRTNCTLPAELWMVDEAEFNESLCMGELVDLGVTCHVISRIVGSAAVRNIKGYFSVFRAVFSKDTRTFYQAKALAILLSSFEVILFLDADNFPLYDPETFFSSHPFVDTGIIAWPDFWHSSVSDNFYNISNMNKSYILPDLHHHKLANANTVESGQIMWNKRTHWKALVLAVYYNIFGPHFFYPLLSLGAPGQGDKETFIMAARVLGDDYYFVSQPVVAIGHYDEHGESRGVAMLQADPVQNFANASAKPFFLHANGYKFNKDIFSNINKSFPSGPRRIWSNTLNETIGYDVEYAAFQELRHIACYSQLQTLDYCLKVRIHITKVFAMNGM